MAWPALAVVLLDQLSKLAVIRNLRLYETVPVIDGFFNLVHIRNRGMAFGLMNRPDCGCAFWFLVAATVCAVILILFWFFRLEDDERLMTAGLSLILGGAVGNLIDRLRLHEVIDFLDFYLGNYHWHAFNVADSAITVGTFGVAVILIFEMKKDIKKPNR